MNTSKVTRVEVIDHPDGRVYTKRFVDQEVELDLQDEGRTLKIFIKKPKEKKYGRENERRGTSL